MKNISVFCGAHEGKNPRYAEDAKKIGEILAAKGINVVFGGGNVGLMKIVSDAALDNGVDAIGIGLESRTDLHPSQTPVDDATLGHRTGYKVHAQRVRSAQKACNQQ